jgi:hypothetical protein
MADRKECDKTCAKKLQNFVRAKDFQTAAINLHLNGKANSCLAIADSLTSTS